MKNFLKKIKRSFAKIPKYELCVFLILSFLWFCSLTDNVMTITIKVGNGYVEGYINNKKWGIIRADLKQIESLEIDLKHHNLPEPLPFKPKIVGIKFFDLSGEVVHKSISPTTQLSPKITATIAEIKLKNCLFAEIKFNRDSNSYYSFLYRPFRERDTNLAFIQNGQYVKNNHRWRNLSFPILKTINFFLKIGFTCFPYLTAFLFGFQVILKIKRTDSVRRKSRIYKNSSKNEIITPMNILVTITLVAAFIYLSWVNAEYVERIPHDPDSVNYLWGAKYLSSGKLWLNNYSDFFPFWSQKYKNHWTIMYPYGHPLAISFGFLFGIPQIIPPLLGTIFLLLFFLITKKLFGFFVAYCMILIIFFSPQFQMQAVNYMSHNTAVFYTIIIIYSLVKIYKKEAGNFFSFIGGAAFALLYLTRPFVAFLFALPLGISIIYLYFSSRKERLKPLSFLITGIILGGTIVVLLNIVIYGNPFSNDYTKLHLLKFIWGGSNLTLLHGLVDSLSYGLVLRLLILPGLPTLLGLSCLGAVFNKRFLGISLLSIATIFSLGIGMATYNDPWGIFLGARFWYEMLPFIFILIAIFFDMIIQMLGKIGYIVVSTVVLLVLFKSLSGWVYGKEKLWENMLYFTPNNIKELRGFNFADARLIKEAKRQNLKNALIFVKDCGGQWWCYGTVLNENAINFDGNIVWAQDLGKRNQELISQYADRSLYIADYDAYTIKPYNYEKEYPSQ